MASSKYISPFNIYVVWHPRYQQGASIADFIYSSFSRDTSAPLSRGIGIPVYYRSKPYGSSATPKVIDLNEAEYNAVVVLVDDELFNDDVWNQFVKDLIPLRTEKLRLYPIAMSANAFYFEETTFAYDQFIKYAWQEEEEKALPKLYSRLLHGFCRLLCGRKPAYLAVDEQYVPAPIKLFISHAKIDGETEAARFRDYVRTNTKLNTFFDANDIADGYKFDDQIRDAIRGGQAALVVFQTDAYATREWCRIEVLTAKRFKAPIVVAYNIKQGEKRSFPYMGNVPTLKYAEENFDSLIDLTLYQVLNNLFHTSNLKNVKELFLDSDYESIELTSPPELYNYIDILSKHEKSSKKQLVIYPDPPIGIEELRVLTAFSHAAKFVTPIQLSTLFIEHEKEN